VKSKDVRRSNLLMHGNEIASLRSARNDVVLPHPINELAIVHFYRHLH
jgi:hypothetical protein